MTSAIAVSSPDQPNPTTNQAQQYPEWEQLNQIMIYQSANHAYNSGCR